MTNLIPAYSRLPRYLFSITLLLLALTTRIYGQSSRSSTDGSTPQALAPGAPAGSYALSGFDNINLYNGSLNFRLPLFQVGGRGTAGYTMLLPIEQHWRVNHNDEFGIYTPNSNWWSGLKPGYGPGVLQGRQIHEGCGNGGPAPEGQAQTGSLTRLTFTAPDGTEYELVDQLTGGQRVFSTCCCYYSQSADGASRGTVFVTKDGSAATFVSDTTIYDWSGNIESGPHLIYPSGFFILRDGTRYRIDNGLVSWIRDRNGNKVSFTYDLSYYRVTGITDAIGRQINISYQAGYDEISFYGFGGTPRTIRVNYAALSMALRSGYSLQTYAQLFPGLHGSSSTLFNTVVVSSVTIPDGRSYQFAYNSHGELARVGLPTGGAFEYDWAFSPIPYYEIYRRVIERRIYPNGGTGGAFTSKTTYSIPATSVSATDPSTVTVEQFDSSGMRLTSQKHYFYGNAGASLLGWSSPSSLSYSWWKEGKEYQTEEYDSNGATLLRQATNNWYQDAPSWWTSGGVTYTHEPSNNPRLIETTNRLVDANLVTKQTFSYDQFNNQTDTYEYDYGTGAAGALVRRTHIDYMTTNPVNGADYTLTSIHIRSLPRAQQVYSVNPSTGAQTLVAQSETRYDEYSLFNYGSVVQWNDPGAARGNATTLRRWIDTNNTWLENRTEYDQVGNVKKGWDARTDKAEAERVTQIEYSSTYHYSLPTHVLSPIPDLTNQRATNTSLETWTTYDFYTGKAIETRDANNFATTYQYNDVLDRPTRIDRPDGGWTNYIYGSLSYGDYIRIQTALNATQTMENYQFFDGLGRSVRTFQYDGSQWITVDTQYDALGRVWRVSNPYLSAGSTSPVNPSGRWTTTTYDALGRVLTVTTPDSAQIVTSYSGNSVTVTDQAGKSKRSQSDGLGRMVQVVEDSNPNGLAYQTTYTYDALDNLRIVAQGGQQRYFMYDSLSRLIRSRTPEQEVNPSLNTAPDPVSGNTQWSIAYTHDNNSNVASRTDARGVLTSYQYDNINRVTQISYNDGTPWNFFRYDFSSNGRGRFYNQYDNSTSGGYEHVTHYDAIGRPLRRQTDLYLLGTGWIGSYVSTRAYDKMGNIVSQTYPSGHTVNYDQFDVAGRLKNFTGNLGNGVARTYATGITYDEGGRLQREQYGTVTPLYHKKFYNVRGQLFDIRLSSVNDTWDWNRGRFIFYYSSNHLWGQSGADNNGNVRFVENWIPPPNATLDQAESVTEDSYTYDPLNRISAVNEWRASAATGWTWAQQFLQSYSYDRYGNRTINGAQTWGAGINSQQFAVDTNTNRLGVPSGMSGAMQYDAAGNLLSDTYSGMGSRTYDAENRMTTASGNGGVQSIYTYDPSGRRVRRSTNGATTWHIYGMDGELLAEYAQGASPAQPQKEYGYRSGELLVIAESGGQVQWLVSDHLGAPRMIADQTGSLSGIKRHDYLPFGEELYAGIGGRSAQQGYVADDVRQKFTQKERDSETGLDYFGARYHSPLQGRFTSPDPLTGSGSPTSPQSWNRYSYCLNNPLIFTDPTGMLPEWRENNTTHEVRWYRPWDDRTGTTEIQPDANGNLIYRLNDNVQVRLNPNGPGGMINWSAALILVAPPIAVTQGINWDPYVRNGWRLERTPEAERAFMQTGAVNYMSEGDAITLAAMFPVARFNAPSVNAAVAAQSEANAAQLLPSASRPGAAGALQTVDGSLFTATSGRVANIHPEVQGILNSTPQSLRSAFHGSCCEVQLLSDALNRGINPTGGALNVVRVRGLGNPLHGTPLPPCTSCQQLINFFKLKVNQ